MIWSQARPTLRRSQQLWRTLILLPRGGHSLFCRLLLSKREVRSNFQAVSCDSRNPEEPTGIPDQCRLQQPICRRVFQGDNCRDYQKRGDIQDYQNNWATIRYVETSRYLGKCPRCKEKGFVIKTFGVNDHDKESFYKIMFTNANSHKF